MTSQPLIRITGMKGFRGKSRIPEKSSGSDFYPVKHNLNKVFLCQKECTNSLRISSWQEMKTDLLCSPADLAAQTHSQFTLERLQSWSKAPSPSSPSNVLWRKSEYPRTKKIHKGDVWYLKVTGWVGPVDTGYNGRTY